MLAIKLTQKHPLEVTDMFLNFLKCLNKVLELPYKSNSQQDPQHEKQVEDLLIEYNINYVAQPNGSQSFPDFHLVDYNLDLECKSSKGTKPMWNRGVPKPGALYIFSSKRLSRTTFFWGHDVCPPQTYKRLVEADRNYHEMINQYNDENDGDGWINYPRLAFDNRGPNSPDYWKESHIMNVLNHNWSDAVEVRN